MTPLREQWNSDPSLGEKNKMQRFTVSSIWLAVVAGASVSGAAPAAAGSASATGQCSAPPCGQVHNTTGTPDSPARDVTIANYWCYDDTADRDSAQSSACFGDPNRTTGRLSLRAGQASTAWARFRGTQALLLEGGCTTRFVRRSTKPWLPPKPQIVDRHNLSGLWTFVPNDQRVVVEAVDCTAPAPPPSPPPAPPADSQKYWVDTFATADGYPSPNISGYVPIGQLFAGRNYVFCKLKGSVFTDGKNTNYWWLWTDLDSHPTGNGKAYVSAYYLTRWGDNIARDNDGVDIPDCSGTPPPPPPPSPMPTTKYWVDTFAPANGYPTANPYTQNAASVGQLFAGTNYVFCKKWGDEQRNGADYNHWWLWTDLDSHSIGNPSAYVAALYLTRWGNDVAKDNSGVDIPDCP
jgi:hypothetical protein